MNRTSAERIEELMAENSKLQQQLLEVHGDFLKKVQLDSSWKHKEKEKLRREVEEEMDVLKKPRVCKNCHESFTLEKNTAQSCTYHPGRYLPRQYPLEGYSWSCCCKRDISSRPCKFAGRHVERETL
ncbi:HIV Tat-specific factor 1 [Aphanomyces cochlioides]|nr:HIV Tat-specific factor 1 [Aphanomyces cochlioides]